MSGFGYNVLGFGANASSAAGGASDDQFNRVSFLSHFDGANNGVNNVFDDGSASNHTITANGNATQGSFGPFARPDGEWGVSFDGSGDYLSIASSADFALGTGDFTVEFFVYHSTLPSATTYFDYRSSQPQATLYLWLYGDTGAIQLHINGTTRAFTPPSMLGRWAHIAIARSSGTTKTFVDGTQYLSFSDSTDYVQGSTFTISKFFNGNENVNGAISNFRWIKGTAVYTSAFTTPTAPLTAITNTKLLTCQSNRFVDNSASGHTVTPAGNAAVTAFGPILSSAVYDPAVNGASASFDIAATTNLTAADSADWDFGSDNYTVEFWVYPRTTGTIQGMFNHWGDFSGSNIAWSFEYHSNGDLLYYFKTNNGITTLTATDGATYANQWMYVTAVRNNNVHTLYLDGVSKASATDAGTMNNCTDVLRIGAYHATYGFNGEICDARIVKGTAVYTGNFTPPTAPLTAITNTKLLLNMADGQAIDSAAQNNLTLVGTAKTSTAQTLYGTASLLLDGNSDLVTLPADAGRLSVSNAPIDFTIELAFRLAANVGGTPNSIIARWETSGANRSWMVRMDNVSSENKIKFFDSSTGSNNASTTFSTAFSSETWYQIALVSASGAVKLYVNGTADSTTHTWTTGVFNAPYDSTALLSIGANVPSSPDNFFNGNIDEVRLSKFARYTSDYTAPTKAFADKGQ